MLNKTVNQLLMGKNAIREIIESLQAEVVQLKEKFETCKAQLARGANMTVREPLTMSKELVKLKIKVDALRAQGASGMTVTARRVEVPRLEAYGSAKKVRKIENLVYGLERYFDALGIVETMLI